ncbi:hypothetical protein EX30DRAFT_397338 [Ascodesmis nigricans]|uniref:Uncharacterized protein n=1 Tax=Ascodesmis nigricans TaxID=341454 RepID=A0A4S2MSQ8_9PEZI|nr:hypothetical protein EX30DRAFT_397338 [Ascodesmis nigricans]
MSPPKRKVDEITTESRSGNPTCTITATMTITTTGTTPTSATQTITLIDGDTGKLEQQDEDIEREVPRKSQKRSTTTTGTNTTTTPTTTAPHRRDNYVWVTSNRQEAWRRHHVCPGDCDTDHWEAGPVYGSKAAAWKKVLEVKAMMEEDDEDELCVNDECKVCNNKDDDDGAEKVPRYKAEMLDDVMLLVFAGGVEREHRHVIMSVERDLVRY